MLLLLFQGGLEELEYIAHCNHTEDSVGTISCLDSTKNDKLHFLFRPPNVSEADLRSFLFRFCRGGSMIISFYLYNTLNMPAFYNIAEELLNIFDDVNVTLRQQL